jgi:hypothetical protein
MGVMGKCRSCGVELVWAKTARGKSMPLEAVAPSDGNVRIVDGVARVGETGSGPYLCHFGRCPDAASWRRRGN